MRTCPAADANRRAAIVVDMIGKRPEGSGLLFDRIYASDKPAIGTRPNALLVAAVENRKPGRALDVGMGPGRNSIYLAWQRWDVTGFDVSETGLEVARKAAAKAGVKIDALRQDAEAFNYGTAQWDLIVITYEPVPLTRARYAWPGSFFRSPSSSAPATSRPRS